MHFVKLCHSILLKTRIIVAIRQFIGLGWPILGMIFSTKYFAREWPASLSTGISLFSLIDCDILVLYN